MAWSPSAVVANDNPALGIGEPTTPPDDPCKGAKALLSWNCLKCKILICRCGGASSPVYVSTGASFLDFRDLEYDLSDPRFVETQGQRLDFDIARTYHSDDFYVGYFGKGFSSSLEMLSVPTFKGQLTDEVVVVHWPDGRRTDFTKQPDGTYTQTFGLAETLEKVPGGFELRDNGDNLYVFDEQTHLLSIADQNGNDITFSYDPDGRPQTITLFNNRQISIAYNASGFIDSISDFAGRTVQYDYDVEGQLTAVTDPENNTTTYTYQDGLLSSVISPLGEVTFSATYDAQGRVTAFTNREGNFTYTYGTNTTTKHDVELNVNWRFDYDAEGLITRFVRPDGVTVNSTFNSEGLPTSQGEGTGSLGAVYDSEGRLAQATDPVGAVTTYTYVPGTRLVETETNHFGVITRYDYDANGLLTRQREAFGTPQEIEQTWTFNPDGTLASHTDPRGNTTSYFYDANNFVTRMVDRESNEWLYQHDSLGNLLLEEDPLGHQTTYTYDKRRLVLTETDDLSRTITHEYDAAGRQTQLTDRRGNVSNFEYNEYDFITAVVGPEPSPGDTRPRTELYYDTHNLLTRKVDPNGEELLLGYNGMNQLTQRVLPAAVGNITTDIVVNAQGFETSMTDNPTGTRTYTYDAMNRLSTISRNLGEGIIETESFQYDLLGRMTQNTKSNGQVMTYGYDILNRRTSASDQIGVRFTAQFDESGNEVHLTMGGQEIIATWDAENRLASATDGTGQTMNYFYDARGLLTTTQTGAGREFNYAYDEFGNLSSTTIVVGGETFDSYAFEYDANMNMTLRTDPLGRQTEMEYDAVNRMTLRRTAAGTALERVETFDHDPGGNLVSRTMPDGASIAYGYDDRNRVTSIDYPGVDEDVAYTYDANGRIASAANSYSSTSYTYELFGSRIRQTTDGRLLTVFTNTPARTVTMNYPSGRNVVRSYDVRGRVTSVTVNAVEVASFTYDNADRVLTRSYANAAQSTYGWEARGLPLSVEHNEAGGSPFWSHTYSFDADAQSDFERDELDANNSAKYEFDGAGRLVEARTGTLDMNDEIPAPTDVTTYGYNALGSMTLRGDNGAPSARTYNEQDEATSVGGTPYVHDGRGNLIDDGTYTYTYDYENRLASVTRKSDAVVVLQVRYDALGNRIETVDEGGAITRHLWSLETLVEERDAGNSVVREFVHRDEKTGLSPLVMYAGATPYYFHEDGRRNVVALTDQAGAVVEQYDYTPYGRTGAASSVGNPFRWAGQRQEAHGWSHFKYRSYDAEQGRFVQTDPRNTPMTPGQLPGISDFAPANLMPEIPGMRGAQVVDFPSRDSQRYRPRDSINLRATDDFGISQVLSIRNANNVGNMDAVGFEYYGLQTPDRASRYSYGNANPLDHWDPDGEFWNPISGGVSGCVLSGCVASGCWGSKCLGSACGKSACIGSACRGSACFGSACTGSVCGGSACGGSACIGSACRGSLCWGSTCVGSLCAGSACIGSMCGGSGCVSSKCGGSACILSVCGYSSRCALSVCYKSACFISICASSKCVQSACIKGSCNCSREMWGGEPTEALASLDIERMPGGDLKLSIASMLPQRLSLDSQGQFDLQPNRLHVFTVKGDRAFDLSMPAMGFHPEKTSHVEFASLEPAFELPGQPERVVALSDAPRQNEPAGEEPAPMAVLAWATGIAGW